MSESDPKAVSMGQSSSKKTILAIKTRRKVAVAKLESEQELEADQHATETTCGQSLTANEDEAPVVASASINPEERKDSDSSESESEPDHSDGCRESPHDASSADNMSQKSSKKTEDSKSAMTEAAPKSGMKDKDSSGNESEPDYSDGSKEGSDEHPTRAITCGTHEKSQTNSGKTEDSNSATTSNSRKKCESEAAQESGIDPEERMDSGSPENNKSEQDHSDGYRESPNEASRADKMFQTSSENTEDSNRAMTEAAPTSELRRRKIKSAASFFKDNKEETLRMIALSLQESFFDDLVQERIIRHETGKSLKKLQRRGKLNAEIVYDEIRNLLEEDKSSECDERLFKALPRLASALLLEVGQSEADEVAFSFLNNKKEAVRRLEILLQEPSTIEDLAKHHVISEEDGRLYEKLRIQGKLEAEDIFEDIESFLKDEAILHAKESLSLALPKILLPEGEKAEYEKSETAAKRRRKTATSMRNKHDSFAVFDQGSDLGQTADLTEDSEDRLENCAPENDDSSSTYESAPETLDDDPPSAESGDSSHGDGEYLCVICQKTNDSVKADFICLDCGSDSYYCTECLRYAHRKPGLQNHKYQNLVADEEKTAEGASLNVLDPLFFQSLALPEPSGDMSWKTKQPNLFKILEVVYDDAESTVIQKVTAVELEISNFCNALAPETAAPDCSEILFDSLESLSMRVIGLTGSNRAVHQFLQETLHLDPSLSYKVMVNKNLFPTGLYGILPNKDSLFLFFWKSDSLFESKAITCQMLRYIRDFSSDVVLCFDTEMILKLKFPRPSQKNDCSFEDVRVDNKITDYSVKSTDGFDLTIRRCSDEVLVPVSQDSLFLCTPLKDEEETVWCNEEFTGTLETVKKQLTFVGQCKVLWGKCLLGENVDDYWASISLRKFLELTFPNIAITLQNLDKKKELIDQNLTKERLDLEQKLDEEKKMIENDWRKKVDVFFRKMFFLEDEKESSDYASALAAAPGEALAEEPILSNEREISQQMLKLRRKTMIFEQMYKENQRFPEDFEDLYEDWSLEEVIEKIQGKDLTNPTNPVRRFISNRLKRRHRQKSLKLSKPLGEIFVRDFSMPLNEDLRQVHLKFYRQLKGLWKKDCPYDIHEVSKDKLEKLLNDYEQKKEDLIGEQSFATKSSTEGIFFGKGALEVRVNRFQIRGQNVHASLKFQRKMNMVSYSVEQMQVTQEDIALGRKENLQIRPMFRHIRSSNVRLNKDGVDVRAIYFLQKQKKVLLLTYERPLFERDERDKENVGNTNVYFNGWNNLTTTTKVLKKFYNKNILLSAFDPEKRLLALWDSNEKNVAIYEFTETLFTLEVKIECLVPLNDFEVLHMNFLHGKEQILFVQSNWKGVVFNINTSAFDQGQLNFGVSKGKLKQIITHKDFVLAIFSLTSDAMRTVYSLRVYSSVNFQTLTKEEVFLSKSPSSRCYFGLVRLQSQLHLACLDPGEGICKSVQLLLASPQSSLIMTSSSAENSESSLCLNEYLENFYEIFRKYAIKNAYENTLKPLRVMAIFPPKDKLDVNHESFQTNLHFYFQDMLKALEKETGKSVWPLVESMRLQVCSLDNLSTLLSCPYDRICVKSLVLSVVTAVPIQIARAENNVLQPLSKGVSLSLAGSLRNVADFVDAISFGILETVLKYSKNPVKIISAKGLQSAGKSFLLNHATGTQFDIAGGRCTQGIWMSIKLHSDVTIIALDFEGMCSFERSRQEDVLMAVFGAAVSSLTVFKTGPSFNEDTKRMFDRLQDGAPLLKQSDTKKQLFRGKLTIVCRDVPRKDASAVRKEMIEKIRDGLEASKENNFVNNLYGGVFRVATSEPFGSAAFLQSFEDVRNDLNEQKFFPNGYKTLELIKTVLAKVHLNDWTALDRARINKQLAMLNRDVETAVFNGYQVNDDFEPSPLQKFGRDVKLVSDQRECLEAPGLKDFLLELHSSHNFLSVRKALINKFRSTENIGTSNWCDKFQTFLQFLEQRRIMRVEEWVAVNTEGFQGDSDARRFLVDTANKYFTPLKNSLTLCKQKCNLCFRPCINDSFHVSPSGSSSKEHDCFTDHKCIMKCSYCERDKGSVFNCYQRGGHTGAHQCKKNHTCSKECELSQYRRCEGICVKKVDHLQESNGDNKRHRCAAATHFCDKKCKSPGCVEECSKPYDHEDKHHCGVNLCMKLCCMKNCNNRCSSTDHFHSLQRNSVHICEKEHQCEEDCEYEGICVIESSFVEGEITQRYIGKHDKFDYVLKARQVPKRKKCQVVIPAGQQSHEGRHTHFCPEEVGGIHFCEMKCPSCENICIQKFGHSGLHTTNHSNMINQIFVSEDEQFQVGGHTYASGESASAEMCNQFCKRLGRGHTHIIPCPGLHPQSSIGKLNHDRKGFRVGPNVVLDEVTHEYYWSSIGFEDACRKDENELFGKCNYFCSSLDKRPGEYGAESDSLCQLPLWHRPKNFRDPVKVGHVTKKGHHFYCKHKDIIGYHLVLVIDRSASMSSPDQKPTKESLIKNHNNRLGAVIEKCDAFCQQRAQTSSRDVVTLITFNEKAHCHSIGERVSPGFADTFASLDICAEGGTLFDTALEEAKEAIQTFSDRRSGNEELIPVVIFLSDGQTACVSESLDKAELLKANYPTREKPVIFTIRFGKEAKCDDVLRKMSTVNEVYPSETSIQLKDVFKQFHEKLSQGTIGVIKA
eukprot:m.214194 g.214194  ORF g.214194 m.214194 type:complete len:2677 (+) comp39806_c0_seq19:846-8876(+)